MAVVVLFLLGVKIKDSSIDHIITCKFYIHDVITLYLIEDYNITVKVYIQIYTRVVMQSIIRLIDLSF